MNKVSLVMGAVLAAVGGLPAMAAEWSATPSMIWIVDTQSNRDLRADEHETQGAFVNLDVLLKRATGVAEISISPHVQLQRYSDNSVADATNSSLALASLWHDERHSLGGQAIISRESTLTSELLDTDIVRGDTIRHLRSASASWESEISERHARQIELSYTEIDYSGEYERELPGYRYPSLSVTERFALSGRSTISFAAFGSELRSPGDSSGSRNYGVQLSLERRLTPRFFALLALGADRTDLGEQTQDGYVAQFTLTREMALGEWRLDYGHTVAASGRGVLVERDRVEISVHRGLAPRLRARLSARSIRNDDIGERLSGERRRYEVAEAGLDWRAAPAWTVGWRVGAARADQPFDGESGEGWRTSLSAWWSPRPWTMSR